MRTLIFSNKQIVEGKAIESGERLFLYMNNINITDAFALLNDPKNTKKIIAERDGESREYNGYKHLLSISEDNDGINASLKK